MPGVSSRQARARDMMMPVAIRVEIGEREFDRECLRATVRLFSMNLRSTMMSLNLFEFITLKFYDLVDRLK